MRHSRGSEPEESEVITRARNERGEGKIGAIIALLVVILVIHVGMKYIPFKVQTAEFEKDVETRLERLAGNLIDEEAFIEGILKDAGETEVPLSYDDLKIELVGNSWRFETRYEIVLEMIWGDWVQEVEIVRERPRF